MRLEFIHVPVQTSLTLTATANDTDGTIARVEFYDGSTKLGQMESAPYTFVWQNVPAGNHLLTARAIDNLGASQDSSPRFLTASGSSTGIQTKIRLSDIANVTIRVTANIGTAATSADGQIAVVEVEVG